MVRFDEPQIIDRLNRLSRRSKAAFAVGCAGRLDPLLDDVSAQDRAVVRECRALLERVIVKTEEAAQLHSAITRLEALESLDVDAVASVAYAMRAWLSDSPQDAAWAARRAYEAQDQMTQVEMCGSGFDEQRLLAHPAVQRELQAQSADLDNLSKGEGVA